MGSLWIGRFFKALTVLCACALASACQQRTFLQSPRHESLLAAGFEFQDEHYTCSKSRCGEEFVKIAFSRGPVVVRGRVGTAEAALRSGKVTVAELQADFEKFDAFKYPDLKFDSARIEPRSASYFASGNLAHSGKILHFKGGGKVVGDEAMIFGVLSTSKALANHYGSETFLLGRQ